jgi:two-component system NtrC family sensor kinase
MNTQIDHSKTPEDFQRLSHLFVQLSTQNLPRVVFLKRLLAQLLQFSGCDVIELWLKLVNEPLKCEVIRYTKQSYKYKIAACTRSDKGIITPVGLDDPILEQLYGDITSGTLDASLPFIAKRGSFWTDNTGDLTTYNIVTAGVTKPYDFKMSLYYKSLALIPLVVGNVNVGLWQLKGRKKNIFTKSEIELYEDFAEALGVVLMNQSAHAALRERVKELTCLYGIAKVVEQPEITLEEILQNIVELLPPGWQYPEITAGRIVLNDSFYTTSNFQESPYKQKADIIVSGESRGFVEVVYVEKKPVLDEGPFLREERNLIDAIARQVALIIERRQAANEREKLEEQLRHADRLATIGQLSAGVAHEFNEPLGNILGFAQLVKKSAELPPGIDQDIDKIIAASLHAREVIKKLMFFARQMPTKKSKVNLNQLVQEGLYFLESRCTKEGIDLVFSLSSNLPEITADPGQMQQVLINLVVNAIQAMPGGGKLSIYTIAKRNHISLVVEDTGIGMSKEVMKQIFIPFFTTKDVGEGTGIGLSVVHGIVTSHGGSIHVESEVGRGSRFEVRLPIM